MNTDSNLMPDLHGTSSELKLKEETHRILGHAFEVINEIAHGLHEKIYENGLTVAFTINGIPFEQRVSGNVPRPQSRRVYPRSSRLRGGHCRPIGDRSNHRL